MNHQEQETVRFTSIARKPGPKPLARPVTRALRDCAEGQTVRVGGSVVRLLETPDAYGVVGGKLTVSARVWLIGADRESTVTHAADAAALVLEA